MKTLWVDASNGAAGDMLLAALLDAGADLDAVRTGLRGIDVEPVGLTLNAVRRHGLRAAQVVVDAPDRSVILIGETNAIRSALTIVWPNLSSVMVVLPGVRRHAVPCS